MCMPEKDVINLVMSPIGSVLFCCTGGCGGGGGGDGGGGGGGGGSGLFATI